MRDEFYGDKRDLVKWGGLLHLCNKNRIKTVLQVAYYRETKWPQLSFDGSDIDLPAQVTNHFRDMQQIRSLKISGATIRVIGRGFSHADRSKYQDSLCNLICSMKERKVVFLDPDTGLAPRKCAVEHVSVEEVSEVWASLKPRDFLVVYQHRFRDTEWKKTRRKQLASACRIRLSDVRMWSAEKIAKDVVFFFVEKEPL